jgi:trans-aconitate 2-methyltransferase
MNDWNPEKYLQFRQERTQPARDLATRIRLSAPASIIDVGCGPGNSTQILAQRWRESAITGLDSSEAMIARARADYPRQTWVCADAECLPGGEAYTLVFSNAALQWIKNHEALIPRLWERVGARGALAVQIPRFEAMPAADAIQAVAADAEWAKRLERARAARPFRSRHEPDFYYGVLSRLAAEIELWETQYFHILPSQRAIVDFIRTTALKPYLERLPDEAEREAFEGDVLAECRTRYPVQEDGNVLFPFKRLFFIAYKA